MSQRPRTPRQGTARDQAAGRQAAPRRPGAVAAVMLLEIVISLAATGGLSDLTLRDVGVLGLAVGLTGCTRHRLVLRG